MKTVGICIGASTISLVSAKRESQGIIVELSRKERHEGNPGAILAEMFDSPAIKNADRIVVTGRKLRFLLNVTSISEIEALEAAYSYLPDSYKSAGTIVSAGGETFMVYRLDQAGRVIDINSGNKCASGTGDFFLQQIKRMDLTIDEAMAIADGEGVYPVAGRCSVFCKSDCTHALNKGASKGNVVAGLCSMMAGKILELLKGKDAGQVLLVGGSSANQMMVEFLKKELPALTVPPYSQCFEALGAAVWAFSHETLPLPEESRLFSRETAGYACHPPLKDAAGWVHFLEMPQGQAQPNDACILGLDVGSTTTKAVLLRIGDLAVLAETYLRTNGDPVAASRRCYAEIAGQLDVKVSITGLGVTGSGRQIAGLHAQTPAVINEIIAHARAAAHFDPTVDTIFEIGGQDAKYTYLTHGVASDYAMNEACSAGTGSFLEESAGESLNIPMDAIGATALEGQSPPNFNDQCAAFISSDIKTAVQSGLSKADIAAGLVYSICMNYLSRVKGSRPVGKRVFMQGGVCYNRAVPFAMANLTGKEIIVPPKPGLMGAFGVALETLSQIEAGLINPGPFDLRDLAGREISYLEPFVCAGGSDGCDRKCTINRLRIAGKLYPFGGACNKYYNLMQAHPPETETAKLDLVALREHLLRQGCRNDPKVNSAPLNGKRLGLQPSLMTQGLFPLYYGFFRSLGYEIVVPAAPDPDGYLRKGAAVCWPMEQAHGLIQALLKLKPDVIFLPHVKAVPVSGGNGARVVCPFIQSEPYVLKASFAGLEQIKLLSPILNMPENYDQSGGVFEELALELGYGKPDAQTAFTEAVRLQNEFHAACRQAGSQVLAELEKAPDEIAIVLFGRPYNALSSLGNLGIPRKFASRGCRIIPLDFLPADDEEALDNMYWSSGQMILKAARFTARHPQLYAAYITNFSCGPDSFLINYFRNIMEQKPSLTLELDSHTADAGVDTRIEAFIDVIKRQRTIAGTITDAPAASQIPFYTARIQMNGKYSVVIDSAGSKYPLTDPRVRVLVPSMGDIGARMLASTLRYVGLNAQALPPPGRQELALGRDLASCKECMPLQLTLGSLMRYVHEHSDAHEILVNFMPETSGPCRFGQYNIMMRETVKKLRLPDIAMLSLTAENSYAGFGVKFALRGWLSVVLSDILDDIYSAILAIAEDPDAALALFHTLSERLCESIARDSWPLLKTQMRAAARELKQIPRRKALADAPSIALIGEIYVRRDEFSRQGLVERLSRKGYWVHTTPVAEWIHYCDYIVQNRLVVKSGFIKRLTNRVTCQVKSPFEKTIQAIFADCGFYRQMSTPVARLVQLARSFISPRLTGEAILTVGAAFAEAVEHADGVLAVGPFGCMPSRIAESIITRKLDLHKPAVAQNQDLIRQVMRLHPVLPFLSIETDGGAFPQVIESRLESFLLQVDRIHLSLKKLKGGAKS